MTQDVRSRTFAFLVRILKIQKLISKSGNAQGFETRPKLIFEYTPQSDSWFTDRSLVGLQFARVELFGVNGNLGK